MTVTEVPVTEVPVEGYTMPMPRTTPSFVRSQSGGSAGFIFPRFHHQVKCPISAIGFRCMFIIFVFAFSLAIAKTTQGEAGIEASGWDRWGRREPLPEVAVVMSTNDALCNSIANAFNQASARAGALYDDPIFMRWRLPENVEGWERMRSSLSPTTILVADVFNVNRPVILVKYAAATGNIDEIVAEFPDVEQFRSRAYATGWSILSDPTATWIIRSFTGQRGLLTAYKPLQKLPSEIRQTQTWRDEHFDEGKEINVIKFKDRFYVVAREPDREISVVLNFSGPNTASEVCYIGPKEPLSERK